MDLTFEKLNPKGVRVDQTLDDLDVDLFLEAIHKKYGYNFKDYSRSSIKRRLSDFVSNSGHSTLADCIAPALKDRNFFYYMLSYILVSVTELFRDPNFFREFSDKVVPMLKTYPYIKIWHAGCASGEEVYSMAILMEELGLSERVLLYATDINEESLKSAREGIFRVSDIESSSQKYIASGGKFSLSEYYVEKYGYVKFHDRLKRNMIFSTHNLESDGIFGDMNVILCRNVFIYFNKALQNKVLSVFLNSLIPRGFLCLGSKESMEFLDERHGFETFSKKENIFRKTLY